jgi:hypothetical protein
MGRTRTIRRLAGAVLGLAAMLAPARAAEDAGLLRMATCQDSWLDWSKSDPARLTAFAATMHKAYAQHGNDAYATPNAATSIAGLKVTQFYPQSVGMGVGLSVLVDATFDKAKTVMEKVLGKKITQCEASDGSHACELVLGEQKNFTMITADNAPNQTLVGCYYYYEK